MPMSYSFSHCAANLMILFFSHLPDNVDSDNDLVVALEERDSPVPAAVPEPFSGSSSECTTGTCKDRHASSVLSIPLQKEYENYVDVIEDDQDQDLLPAIEASLLDQQTATLLLQFTLTNNQEKIGLFRPS